MVNSEWLTGNCKRMDIRKHSTQFVISNLLLVLFFAACNSKPSGIIQPEEMKMIIWDLEKAGQFVSNDTSAAVRLNLKDSTTAEFRKVLAIHKTTQDAFLKSLVYYEQNPEAFKTLIDSTTAMAGRIQVKIERQRHVKDSIRNKHITDSTKIADSLKKSQTIKDTTRQHKKNISKKI